jgi:signal transduction histidine kinase/CHASE3 domain sensor protein/FixJ family two-component response regulator
MSKLLALRANTLGLIAALLVLLAVGMLTWERFAAIDDARGWVRHTYDVIGTIDELGLAVRDAEAGERGYLLTGDVSYLAPYQLALDRASLLQGDLQRSTADNPRQQERLQRLAPIVQRRMSALAETIQLRRDVGLEAALRRMQAGEGRRLMDELTALLGDMAAEERSLLEARTEAADRSETIARFIAMAGAALAIAMMFFAIRMLQRARAESLALEVEQRRLASHLRTSLDSLSQGVAVFGSDRLLSRWNDRFVDLLRLPKPLLTARTGYDALAEHLANAAGAAFLEPLGADDGGAQRAVVYERRLPPRDKSADERSFEIRRTPMPDRGFVLTVTDMTDRVRAEELLRESQKMQALGQLTGGLAHDFNNLLTVVIGNVDFVREQLGPDHPAVDRLRRSLWAAQRGGALTHQLLAFARKQPLEPQPLDISVMLPDMAGLLKRTLGEHIEVRVVDSAGLWPAMADAAQLENALLNLALNARDAMPGGGRLTIEVANKVIDADYAAAHVEVAPGDYVMLAVSDSGHGMAPDIVARAFEPFFTTKPDGKGTGLGLAQVFGFVKQSAGHVMIYSEPGDGTTVRIYLPRAIGLAAPGPRMAPPLELPRGSATVLVVEDDDGVREIAVAQLRQLGYRVFAAPDGEAGLKIFGEHAAGIDALLVDVVLPGRYKGRAVAEMMSAIRPGLKVLYMSGYTENAIVHHGRLDDGVQLISKPFKREQLARKLAEVLGVAPAAEPPSGTATNVVELADKTSRNRGRSDATD